jgi:hypothetical protein
MGNRRRHTRCHVTGTWEGDLRFTRQTELLTESERHVTVLCDHPVSVGQSLELEVVETETNRSRTHRLRVAATRPVLLDGGLRHEVMLLADQAEAGASGGGSRK